ncbi:Transposon Tf2-1 polyprotein [Rhizoctonia solani]|uniref:Transposon Tf2-1 polyprotein n=1 Tax=Rhizoctonia solani TaxID=456999 RepID=A0A8H8SZ64_9AGAM|nr:Transposon Tf2-1 polyprotein [Rhizoctonia solani]QRW23094.1 Transposon Tf2-1 polyprotein [Rhizoctonia solani]
MSTQPSTYVHADPNALSVPTNIQEIPAWAQEIKNLLLAMNQNLSLVIGQAAAHHTDLGTTQATLNNHDSSITNLDALIVKLGADIAKIGTAAASGSSIASATKAPKLATPDKFDGSDKNKAISFRVAVSHYLRISYPGSTVDEQIAFIISCLDGKAHEWLEPYLEEDVVKGNPVSWLHNLDAFWLQFNARWNVQNRTENFRAKLRTLKQTKGVQDYYKDFQTYSQGLGYNDPSLRDMFYDGLSHKIKETLMVQDYDHADASVTLATLAEKALKVDQRLEQFAAQHKGSSSSSNQSGSKSSTSTSAAAQGAPRDKLSVGEQVYAIVDGKAKKGVLQKIGQNAKGIAVPIVKWNDGTTMDVTFKTIKKDNHPITATSTPAPKASSSSSARNSGPSPMDLDSASSKGKKPIICATCGGRGHYANQCPSKSYSGHEAHISEDESENGDL